MKAFLQATRSHTHPLPYPPLSSSGSQSSATQSSASVGSFPNKVVPQANGGHVPRSQALPCPALLLLGQPKVGCIHHTVQSHRDWFPLCSPAILSALSSNNNMARLPLPALLLLAVPQCYMTRQASGWSQMVVAHGATWTCKHYNAVCCVHGFGKPDITCMTVDKCTVLPCFSTDETLKYISPPQPERHLFSSPCLQCNRKLNTEGKRLHQLPFATCGQIHQLQSSRSFSKA